MNECVTIESPGLMKKGWTVHVDVIVEDPLPGDPPDQVRFSLDSKLKGPNGALVFNKTNDGMKKVDYYLVEFDLVDKSSLDLSFAPNPMVAFWVNWNSQSCPNGACYSHEIYAVGVDEQHGKKLLVRNEDNSIVDFAFSLGFLKGGFDPSDPNGYIRYDPIGTNQDGGSS